MPDKPPSDGPAPPAEEDSRPVTDEPSCSLSDGAAGGDACPVGPPLSADALTLMEEADLAEPDVAEKHGALGEARTGRIAALIYTGISLLAATVFVLVTTYAGSYPAVARYGGAAWIFLLTMIVLMPFVIPRVRKWRG